MATSSSTPAVLIVDDESTVRSLLSLICTRSGARAHVAASGAEARKLLEERTYAAAMLDKNLPDATGLELMAVIKKVSPATECFIVTGYASTESAIEAVRLGAFDYIVKPFDVTTVQVRLSKALERARLAADLEAANAALRRRELELSAARDELRRAYSEVVNRLSLAIEYRSEPEHVERVARYAGILARAAHARAEWVELLCCAAPLHDIGNVGVPDAILHKASPLTLDERAKVQEHVVIGARILDGAESAVLVLAREIVLGHHERWDGRGYPAGLAGEVIPLSARIVAIADAWDAMTTDRVYRRAPGDAHAEAELREQAGKMFDPHLVELFLAELPKIKAARLA